MRLHFPTPPTLNKAYPTFNGRRIPSRELKAWKIAAAKVIQTQIEQMAEAFIFKKHYALHYRFNINHNSDIGNREKCASDLLVKLGIIPDDCWCDKIIIERDRTITGASVEITQL